MPSRKKKTLQHYNLDLVTLSRGFRQKEKTSLNEAEEQQIKEARDYVADLLAKDPKTLSKDPSLMEFSLHGGILFAFQEQGIISYKPEVLEHLQFIAGCANKVREAVDALLEGEKQLRLF